MNQFDQAPVNGEAIEESIAIVCNGDTAPKAIAAGQYMFIKNHSTLATGGYHATDAIASGDTLSSSNVTSDPDGIANAINGKIPAVVNNLTSDSTTDALSAAQGKALNSKITTLNSKFTVVTFNATSSNSIVDISSWVSSDKLVISAVSGAGNMVSIPFLDNNGKWFLFLRGTASWQTLADSQRNFRVVYMS